jgi:large subunit ribosomal protein L15e
MGIYKYVREAWKKPTENLKGIYRERISEWSKGESTVRVDRPTRIDRARALGYKAKQGYVMVRQRVPRGGKQRHRITGGRRSKHNRRNLVLAKNYRLLSEERCQRKYPNLEVLNSYFVGKNKSYYFYEIILVDKEHPSIKADSRINWICDGANTRRVFRGLTSAGRKIRGLRHKGKGAEKLRPSKRVRINKKSNQKHANKTFLK